MHGLFNITTKCRKNSCNLSAKHWCISFYIPTDRNWMCCWYCAFVCPRSYTDHNRLKVVYWGRGIGCVLFSKSKKLLFLLFSRQTAPCFSDQVALGVSIFLLLPTPNGEGYVFISVGLSVSLFVWLCVWGHHCGKMGEQIFMEFSGC